MERIIMHYDMDAFYVYKFFLIISMNFRFLILCFVDYWFLKRINISKEKSLYSSNGFSFYFCIIIIEK